MERYLLFRGRNYYPSGGIDDLIGDYPTLELAIEAANSDILKDWEYSKFGYDSQQEYIDYEKEYSWGHIYDIQTKSKVWEQS